VTIVFPRTNSSRPSFENATFSEWADQIPQMSKIDIKQFTGKSSDCDSFSWREIKILRDTWCMLIDEIAFGVGFHRSAFRNFLNDAGQSYTPLGI
jgi:hypothetical protein